MVPRSPSPSQTLHYIPIIFRFLSTLNIRPNGNFTMLFFKCIIFIRLFNKNTNSPIIPETQKNHCIKGTWIGPSPEQGWRHNVSSFFPLWHLTSLHKDMKTIWMKVWREQEDRGIAHFTLWDHPFNRQKSELQRTLKLEKEMLKGTLGGC